MRSILLALPLLIPLPATGQLMLSVIEKTVSESLPVPNLTWQEFRDTLASFDSTRLLIFDTREPEEYHTSHLRSAIQVDPHMPAEDFFKTYSDTLKGRRVVFYCSVGYRSSQFLRRVQAEVLKAGAFSAANLRGGIFRWYNEGNPVVDQNGMTDNIHPYDEFWGVLVRKQSGQPATEK